MRIPSGVTDKYIYFVAVDITDLKTRETGLSGFTVYRSRNGAAAAAMDTPTINETDATNMPGVYELLADEDMTIGTGNDSEEMCFHIAHASMASVTRTIELYRPKITAGYTLGVESDGDLTKVNLCVSNTDMVGTDGANTTTPPTAAAIVDEWETQSQNDPTGFHVNIKEIGDIAQTANDNGADINTLLARIIGTLAAGTHTVQSGDSFARIGAAGVSLTDLGGMSASMQAEVLTQINAALNTAISELGVAAPTATPTLRTGLMLLYMALRNKLDVQTSGTDSLEVHNDAGTKIAEKLVTDDGTDYSEAKMS